MNQCPDRDQLELLLANCLVETARDELEGHVEGCAACQQMLEALTDATVWGLEQGPDVLKFVAGNAPGLVNDPLRATAVATAKASECVGRGAPTVAGYEIKGELGRGGMGVVYEARHVRLNRSCALKMILAGAHASREDVARFLTEAEAIARVQHPHIVQIHQIGEADGVPYFELEYLSGGSLDRQLDGTPWPATRAARLAEQVALGIAEAHRQGIVHRDLKPSNVLLAAEGTPKVGDFGLAKMLNTESGLTRTESVMGSPSYMAPEQAQGRAKEAGPAVDVYAVGAILYELLTGRPPFRGTTVLETLEQVKTTEPVRPSRMVPGMPRDIETICLKCLQKEPGKRYTSAQALAEDLRRFLDGRPILARRSTSAERFWRWCRRNPGLAAANMAAAVLMTLLFLGTAAAAWTFRNQRDQIRGADRKTREGLFESLTVQARATRFSHQVGQRFESLDALEQAARIAREIKLSPDRLDPLRDQAIACLALPDMKETGRVIHCPPGVIATAFDPTMTRYALRFRNGAIQVRRVADDVELARFQARGDREIFVFGFSPDGRYLATNHFPGFALTVWDIGGATVVLEDPGPVRYCSADFSPESRGLALAREDGEIVVYDLTTARKVGHWRGPAPPNSCAFSPDGRKLAVSGNPSQGSTCQIFDMGTGQLLRSLPLPRIAEPPAWSPDGRTLATPCGDSKIYLWEADTGKRRAVLEGSTNGGLIAAFHPSGTLVASNGWEGRLRLWDAVLGRHVLSLTGGMGSPDIAFSQDGRIVVALEDELTTYQVDPALEYRTFAHVSSEPMNYQLASIRRDGRLLAVGTDRGVVLWDLASGRELGFLPIGLARHLMFEASGDLLTNGSIGVRRWPVQLELDRREFRIGPPHLLPLPSGSGWIAGDRAGRIVALANFGATHVVTPERNFEVGPLDDVRYVAVSPDGQWLATGSHGMNGAQVWRIGDAARVADLRVEGLVEVAFSPDGKWLLTSPAPCRLWAVGTWREAGQPIGGTGHGFSPDSRLVVVQDASKALRLVETESGRTLARLESPDSCDVRWATFTPDGSSLVVTTPYGPAVHVWDLRAIRKRLAAMGLDWDAPAYSDDDPAAASLPPLPPLQVDLGPLAGPAGELPVNVFAPAR